MFFFLMILLPPSSTLTHTLFPYTTLFRSVNSLARRSFLLFVPSAPMASAHGRTKEKGGARSAPPCRCGGGRCPPPAVSRFRRRSRRRCRRTCFPAPPCPASRTRAPHWLRLTRRTVRQRVM